MEPDVELQRNIDIVNGLAGVLDRLSQMLRFEAMAEKQPTPSSLTSIFNFTMTVLTDLSTRYPTLN